MKELSMINCNHSQRDHCRTLPMAANKASGYPEKAQGREIVPPRGPPTLRGPPTRV
ncbi:hypothetical protein CY34DRAFT_811304 [Suillus luteus UH-Slu-Lm8-n1]|uniref:Unplaced genomic scaffold CY34scaffold_402, whole genome shotgun sequence n=1 Tax=Suillus luteus UH-Slu-Lm8-n1 TaxID=930992 RepID=A0A0C9ZG19_9AGAM|nr:hypothetical protein CY34DRAFT_811304 [Suillus luteus UH-Slu-Lm8-n1]